MNPLQSHRKKIDLALASHSFAQKALHNEEKALYNAREQEKHTLEAQGILQGLAEHTQQLAHQQIAAIVTRCLQAVFQEDSYEFKIDFVKKRNQTEASLLFVRDGMEIDPVDSSGGGVVDVASFSLRLACLIMSRPAHRRLLVLDEPWKHVSASYRPYIREIVQVLAKEMNVQFLIVTHDPAFMIGKVIELD